MTNSEKEIHNQVIFDHDRTCCVCRDPNRKYIQVHHIDSNHANNAIDNLTVLCNDCHIETQLEGGFYRKLNPDLVRKYKDEWLQIVKEKGKGKGGPKPSKTIELALPNDPMEKFISQFSTKNILPINSTFYFEDYYISSQLELNLVIINRDLTEENERRYKNIIRAYMLCTLGEIAPQRSLKYTSANPKDSIRGINIDENTQVYVPTWSIPIDNINFIIQLLGSVNYVNNYILLTFVPFAYKMKDADKVKLFIQKIEEIVRPIIGLKLDL